MKHLILYIVGVILPLVASAQRSMTLQECIQMGTERNLDLRIGQAAVDKATILQKTAVDLDKTSLLLSQDPTSGGSSENSWSVSQSFSFPTVYGARKWALRSETELKRTDLEVIRHDMVREITSAYYTLLYHREVLKLYSEQDTIYKKFVHLADAKYKMGEAGQLEKMNAERLYNENKLVWQQEEKNYQVAQLTLQRWIGLDEAVLPADTGYPVLAVSVPDGSFDFARTPWAKVYQKQQTLSENNLTVEKRSYLPDFNIALRSQLVLKAFNPYNVDRSRFDKGNFMGFEVGVSFPLFFGAQKAKVKAAKQELLLTKLKGQQATYQLQKKYQESVNDYWLARKNLEYYERNGKPEADRMLRISQVSYEKGEIGYVEYIQNLKTAADIHLQYVKAVNDYNQAVILLNYLQGK